MEDNIYDDQIERDGIESFWNMITMTIVVSLLLEAFGIFLLWTLPRAVEYVPLWLKIAVSVIAPILSLVGIIFLVKASEKFVENSLRSKTK